MSASWSRVLGLMITSSWLLLGCSSAKKIDVGGACVLNSDCNQGLVCTWGKCHVACHTSADCQPGQSCITVSAQSTVCESPTSCIYNSDCPTGLICAVDQQCRRQCQTNVDCTSGQICTSTQTCAELSQVDSNNNLIGPDGGVLGAGGPSGTGGSGGGGVVEAGVPDAAGAQPDVPTGGTGGDAASVDSSTGVGGREAGVPDAPGAQPDVPIGGTGGAFGTGGVAGTGVAFGTGGVAGTGGVVGTGGVTGDGLVDGSSDSHTSGSQTVTAISAGDQHTCALTSAGGVMCWGFQIGTTRQSAVPVAVPGLSSGVAAISAGYAHTCALTSAGGVMCWGFNYEGQLGNNSTTNSDVPVAVSGLSSGVASISAGQVHTCALTSAGGVMCWGENGNGALGNGSFVQSAVPVAVSGLSSRVTAISAGAGYTCALTSAGGVMCWGNDVYGVLGINNPTISNRPVAVSGLSSGVTAISAGEFHACALTSAGSVMCWGDNSSGELGDNSTTASAVPVVVSGLSSKVTAISASVSPNCIAVSDGGSFCGGTDHTCALTSAGIVMCWGYNGTGQLGDNSTTESNVPVAVSGLSSGVAAISAGASHTCALTSAGGVMCWGDNVYGELGNNSGAESDVPVSVIWAQ